MWLVWRHRNDSNSNQTENERERWNISGISHVLDKNQERNARIVIVCVYCVVWVRAGACSSVRLQLWLAFISFYTSIVWSIAYFNCFLFSITWLISIQYHELASRFDLDCTFMELAKCLVYSGYKCEYHFKLNDIDNNKTKRNSSPWTALVRKMHFDKFPASHSLLFDIRIVLSAESLL